MATSGPGGMREVVAIQCGLGCDQHGQDAVKAARRAVCNAIQYIALPQLEAAACVPPTPRQEGGRQLLVHVKLGVPEPNKAGGSGSFDSVKSKLTAGDALKGCFPYGTLLPVEVTPGGLCFSSGTHAPHLGDSSDEMVAVVAAVTVGY